MSKERWLEDRDKLWQEILDNEYEKCLVCSYCDKTTDAYATGDSPSVIECNAPSAEQCYLVDEQWRDGMYEG